MSRLVTYEVTLEIDVEVEDEIPQEMNFGTFVEDGTLSIYAKRGEDRVVGCIQRDNKAIFVSHAPGGQR